jgi:glycerophosphoryl diester phosphodiesterase
MRLVFFFFLLPSALLEAQQPVDQAKGVIVISHRGEHLRHPENTMPAFTEAVRVRADYIEVDVRTTSDGKLVLMHDADVGRTTNGKGEVSRIAFTGTKVPTLDEVLDFARGKIGVYVDCKAISAKDLVEHVNAHGMTDQVVIYSGRMSKDVQELDPRLKIMPEARNAEFAKILLAELHVKVMAFDAADFNPEVIAVAKQGNAQVFVDRLGAADNPAAWAEAVQWGATGIQTDHPEALVKFLRENGYHK